MVIAAVLEPAGAGAFLLLLPHAARPRAIAVMVRTVRRCRCILFIRPGCSSGSGFVAGQSQRAFRDNIALDLVGPGPDRAGLVVEPRALPGTIAGIPRRASP